MCFFMILLYQPLMAQEDTPLEDYYTEVEREGDVVYVIFNEPLVNEDDELWAYVLLGGFEITYENARLGDTLAVGIIYEQETSKIYYVDRDIYHGFITGEISDDDFIDAITWEEVE